MPRVSPHCTAALPTDFNELVRMHPPRAIKDQIDYDNMQEAIDALTCIPKLSRGQKEYLETLTILFAAYEDVEFKAPKVTPIAALHALMAEHEMSASELGRLLGERSLGSKILNSERELSKAHIRTLSKYFGVGVDLFF